MSANSKIEWCDHTFNPWIGCTKVGPGCDHCYAEKSTPARTMRIVWGAGATRHRTARSTWAQPLKWNDQAEAFQAKHGRRQRVFCASLADVFDNAVPQQWRTNLFALFHDTPNLDWLLLTKRIGNAAEMLQNDPPEGLNMATLPNLWIGATIVNQEEADRDIPKLWRVPAAKRFLSIEPLLGPINLSEAPTPCPNAPEDCCGGPSTIDYLNGSENCPACEGPEAICGSIDWVIVGGESGTGARPMHPDWARGLRDQCEAAGVPFLFKQWGDWHPAMGDASRERLAISKHDGLSFKIEAGERPRMFDMLDRCQMHRVGKHSSGRLLDGRTWDGFPA